MMYQFADVAIESGEVVGTCLVQVDEEEDVGPLVVVLLHMVLKALNTQQTH